MQAQMEALEKLQGAAMSPQYGEMEYWNGRYELECATFDWYQSYFALRPLLRKYVPLESDVLQIGVGTSRLQCDMAEDGYKRIVNTDYAPVVVRHMREAHADVPGLSYEVSDARDMPEFKDGAFGSVVDKGTLDAMFCGINASQHVAAMVAEVYRVLQPGGVFFEVTYGAPCSRLAHLQAPHTQWQIQVFTVAKPLVRSEEEVFSVPPIEICGPYAITDQKAMGMLATMDDLHFVYVCTKPPLPPTAADGSE